MTKKKKREGGKKGYWENMAATECPSQSLKKWTDFFTSHLTCLCKGDDEVAGEESVLKEKKVLVDQR